jgi:hypothetical protein
MRACFFECAQDQLACDLINRAARFSIKVYTPIIYQYGNPESEAGLRKLVRDIVKDFPTSGLVLLTEGFGTRNGEVKRRQQEYLQDCSKLSKAVGIVAENVTE